MTPDAQRIYQLIIDAGGAKAGADLFKRAAEQISEASAKAAAAGKPLRDSVAAAEASYAKLVNRIDPVAAAQVRMARELGIVERAFAAQKITIEEAAQRITQIGQRYDVAIDRAKRMQGALGQTGGGAGRFGTAIQQAGYQVGDFAVQVASGQNAMVAFTQQGAQLAGFFGGPWGAVAGAAIGTLGALAVNFLDLSSAAEKSAESQKNFADALKGVYDAMNDIAPKFEASQKALIYAGISKATEELQKQETILKGMVLPGGRAGRYEDPGYGAQAKLVRDLRAQLEEMKTTLLEIGHLGGVSAVFAGAGSPPEKPSAGARDPGADAIAALQEQVALYGDLSAEERALYDVSIGRYKDESQAEKDKIVSLARTLDLMKSMTDEHKKLADLSKRQDTAEVAEYDRIIEEASRAWDQRVSHGAQLTAEVQTPAEKYLATIQDLAVALTAGTISQETYNRQIAKAQDAFDAAADGTSVFRDAADDAMGILQAGLIDAAFEADNLKEALAGVLEQLAKMAANKAFGLLADKGIDALFGLFSGGGGGAGVALNSSGFRASGAGPGASAAAGGFFSWLGGLFGFSGGGVMTSAGPLPLRQYSGGGIANTPQVAMFAEGGVPEAYVPVPNGMIPVEIRGGGGGGRSGGGIVITNNIKIEGSAGTPDQNNDLANKMQDQVTRAVKQAIDSQLADQQRSGGLLSSNSMGFG